ncbi:MAG: polysaccharide deacetylase family protein [Gammaproteobacteria bacterium]
MAEWHKRALLLLSPETASLPEVEHLRRLGLPALQFNSKDLNDKHEEILELLQREDRDLLIFTENDQVLYKGDIGYTIRITKAGYTSISGIDDAEYLNQTMTCLQDLVRGQTRLDWQRNPVRPCKAPPGALGIGLIFDTEQLGGVRFGLPGILDLLDELEMPATFFVTGWMLELYPDLANILKQSGHCVGVHGRFHEYLPVEFEQQSHTLKRELEWLQQLQIEQPGDAELLRRTVIYESKERLSGANFIFRSNANTHGALAALGFSFFMVSMEHVYTGLAYRKMPTAPMLVWTPNGTIWMLPVSVETYNRPRSAVRLALKSAIRQARAQRSPSVQMLMHPFRDGSARHLQDLRAMLSWLKDKQGMRAVRLDDLTASLPSRPPNIFIYCELSNGEMCGDPQDDNSGNKNPENDDWQELSTYWRRLGSIYEALEVMGLQPALVTELPSEGNIIAVAPYFSIEAGDQHYINADPLGMDLQTLSDKLNRALNELPLGQRVITFRKGSGSNQLRAKYCLQGPKEITDLAAFIPEHLVEAINRITGWRHLF